MSAKKPAAKKKLAPVAKDLKPRKNAKGGARLSAIDTHIKLT